MATFNTVLAAVGETAAIKAPHNWELIHISGSKELKPELISKLKNIAAEKTTLRFKEDLTTYSY